MKKVSNSGRNRASTGNGERDQDDGGAMSPTMRELILRFVTADSERTWDAAAYTRRSAPATRR